MMVVLVCTNVVLPKVVVSSPLSTNIQRSRHSDGASHLVTSGGAFSRTTVARVIVKTPLCEYSLTL